MCCAGPHSTPAREPSMNRCDPPWHVAHRAPTAARPASTSPNRGFTGAPSPAWSPQRPAQHVGQRGPRRIPDEVRHARLDGQRWAPSHPCTRLTPRSRFPISQGGQEPQPTRAQRQPEPQPRANPQPCVCRRRPPPPARPACTPRTCLTAHRACLTAPPLPARRFGRKHCAPPPPHASPPATAERRAAPPARKPPALPALLAACGHAAPARRLRVAALPGVAGQSAQVWPLLAAALSCHTLVLCMAGRGPAAPAPGPCRRKAAAAATAPAAFPAAPYPFDLLP